jgi:hypothetical protein
MGQDIGNNFNPMHCTHAKIKLFFNNVSFTHTAAVRAQLWFKRSGRSWRTTTTTPANIQNSAWFFTITQEIYWTYNPINHSFQASNLIVYSTPLLLPAATIHSCGKVLTEVETMANPHLDVLSDLSDLELSESGTADNNLPVTYTCEKLQSCHLMYSRQ